VRASVRVRVKVGVRVHLRPAHGNVHLLLVEALERDGILRELRGEPSQARQERVEHVPQVLLNREEVTFAVDSRALVVNDVEGAERDARAVEDGARQRRPRAVVDHVVRVDAVGAQEHHARTRNDQSSALGQQRRHVVRHDIAGVYPAGGSNASSDLQTSQRYI